MIRYTNDVIIPYQPKQVVIYCGDNDLAGSDTVTSETVLSRFKILFEQIRGALPQASIVYVSIKPSPSRQRLMPQMEKANQLIRHFLKTKKKTAFVDVYHPMLDADGNPKKELFVVDMLHMNAKGYAIWKKEIIGTLIKD